jgi:hypothetical protein
MAEHDDWVEIRHPKFDKDAPPARVAPQSVKHWQERGWTFASKEDEKKVADAGVPTADPKKAGNA